MKIFGARVRDASADQGVVANQTSTPAAANHAHIGDIMYS